MRTADPPRDGRQFRASLSGAIGRAPDSAVARHREVARHLERLGHACCDATLAPCHPLDPEE